MPQTKEWTVMFYLASDNPLAPGTISHLKNIKNAGYHPEANVLVQFDPHTVNMPVHIFDVNRMEKLKFPNRVNIGFPASDSFVRNLAADKLWDADINKRIKEVLKDRVKYNAPVPWKRLADEQEPKKSLGEFLRFCREKYPARHYMLFMIGHGLAVGNELFLLDEHTTNNDSNSTPRSLLLKDLGEVLDKFNSIIKEDEEPGQLELVGFHSCSMSGAEVALQLKGKANYMLAAQGPTYLGSWPYRQILIRLFNDLNSAPFTEDDIETNGMVDRVKVGSDPTSRFLRDRLNGNGGRELLSRHSIGHAPQKKLVEALAHACSGVLCNPKLIEEKPFENVALDPSIRDLFDKHRRKPFDGGYLRWLNQQLLLDALPKKQTELYTKARIKRLIVSIFQYCLFNSYDFQIAGYNCDLTLCDLHKVEDIQKPVRILVSNLIKGLRSSKKMKDPLIRDLVILAHWEAQSYYEEKYTDLYDFCFRLKLKCEQAKAASKETGVLVNQIRAACYEVMKVLKRGYSGDDNGVIVRCEYCGPDYQYSHGLSVYFPWTDPVGNPMWREQYAEFEFTKGTRWHKFLKVYFKETKRLPQQVEEDDLDKVPVQRNLDQNLIDLLQEITARSFNDDGQLKGGGRDPLGPSVKGGGQDPTGSDCDCGSIKNYPHVTRRPVINLARSLDRSLPRPRRT